MTTITTKQGNTLELETFESAVYVRTAKGSFKIQSFDYLSGQVALFGPKGGFTLATNRDKMHLAGAIDCASTEGDAHKQISFPDLPTLNEFAYEESIAALEAITGVRP